jgi:hypothetical protein
LQTAVAAGAPLQEYVLHILQTPPEDIAAAPEQFAPRAWVARHLDGEPRDGDDGHADLADLLASFIE